MFAHVSRIASLAVALFATSRAAAQSVLVLPYVQPGSTSSAGKDAKSIHWWTDQKPGAFVVEYVLPDGVRQAKPTQVSIDFPSLKPAKAAAAEADAKEKEKKEQEKAGNKDAGKETDDSPEKDLKVVLPPETEQHYLKYSATLLDLPLDTAIRYRVKLGDKIIREATFRTQASADKSVRCVVVGDLAQGRPAQKEVAFEISKKNPEFLVALGDIVYPSGRLLHYQSFYWGTYNNVAEAGPKTGAPLMATVPFYAVLGNHDVLVKPHKVPDAFGVYYAFTAPKNGPGEGPWATPLTGDDKFKTHFRAAAADSYPNLDAYSFDYGPAHFVVVNSNANINLDAPEFRKWLTNDLHATKARWKFVNYHIPAFQSSKQHYAEQQIRKLHPLLEAEGVDMTFAGHVHNYQRSVPIKFEPMGAGKKRSLVDGTFTLDKTFDGDKNTKPKGVIHVVAGGGGATLYGPNLEKSAEAVRKQYGANYADFTAKMVEDRHSFVTLDLAPTRLEMIAYSQSGAELDRIVITK